MQLILEERLTESLLNLTLASVGVLPAVEADVADDRIDVADHPLDHDRGVLALCFLEELGEGGLAAFFLLDRGGRLVSRGQIRTEYLAIHDGAGHEHQLRGVPRGLGGDALTVRFLVFSGELRGAQQKALRFFQFLKTH